MSITTEVSSRTAAGTSVLDPVVTEELVGVRAVAIPLFDVDRRQLPELLLHLPERLALPWGHSVRHEVGDRFAVARHDEGLPRLDPPHDLGVVIAQLTLRDGLGHDTSVALQRYSFRPPTRC